ncbi:MAG: phosphotransferase [Opitutales bacterium]|nr:phosphotransferase [Opitutales bacterium]
MKNAFDSLIKIGFSPVAGSLKPAAKGGSSRTFTMFLDAKAGACVLCEYSPEKEENFLYADIAKFLKSCSIKAPEVLFHDPQTRTLVMSNLGGRDLSDFCAGAEEEQIENIYKKTLALAAALHTRASAKFFESPVKLMPKFDSALYCWEQNYFFENLVKDRLNLGVQKPEAEWKKLSEFIQSFGECLIHRDLQSQNAIVSDGGGDVGFIDFQGMRLGCCWYDVGSLLFDPYQDVGSKARAELFSYYCSIRGADARECAPIFCAASAQRLMQALGAYAFLADKKGKTAYLKYIPKALENLELCAEAAGLEKTLAIAREAKKKLV